MNGIIGRRISRFFLVAGFCALSALAPQSKADQWNQKVILTFDTPVAIPGMVLQPGTYVFRLVNMSPGRDVVQVFNKDENTIYATILTIPDHRAKLAGKTVITFDETAAGSPKALKAWFYPGENYGHDFVYSKAEAATLAQANNTAVPAMSDESPNTAQATPSNGTQSAAAPQTDFTGMERVPLKAENPNNQETELAEAFPNQASPNSADTMPSTLPKTGSELPLIGLIGLLSLGMPVTLRSVGAKTK